MNQNEKVLKYLDEHGSISTFEAFNELGITRLASRIHDLREDGYAITSKTIWKGDKHWNEYRFEGSEENV